MKNILYIYILASVVLFSSCNDSEDLMTADAQEGVRITSSGSSGGLLGLPDATTGAVTFLDVSLNYKLNVTSSNPEDVESVTVIKKFTKSGESTSSAEAIVGNYTDIPVEITYTSINDYLDGLGLTEDLLIGDQIAFSIEINMTDGRVLTDRAASFPVNVACLSDLAGQWSSSHDWDPNCDGNMVPIIVTITEVEGVPGKYLASDVMDLYFGGDVCTPAELCGFITDVCGELTITSGAEEGCSSGVNGEGTGTLNADATRIEMTVYNDAIAADQDIVLERI